jgi:DNA repair exonuclease SbcCD nuclease subunit
MRKPIALWFADSHLDPYIWKSRRDIAGDSFASFHWLLKVANRLDVPVFIAGDVVDMQKPSSSVVWFMTKMHNFCSRHTVDVHFIQGQHDRADPPWLTASGRDKFKHAHGQQIIINDHKIFALDWRPRNELMSLFEEYESEINTCDTLMLHQVWKELMGNIRVGELGAEDIPSGPKTVFTGDMHRNDELDLKNKNGEAFRLISPGSTHMRSAIEQVKKYYYLLMDDGSWLRKELKGTRKIASYSIRSPESVEYTNTNLPAVYDELTLASQKLHKSIKTPLILLRYHPDYYDDCDEIRRKVEELGMLCVLRASQAGMSSRVSSTRDDEDELEFETAPEEVRINTSRSIEDCIRAEVTDDDLAKEILLRTVCYMDSPAEAREELDQLFEEYKSREQVNLVVSDDDDYFEEDV